MPEDAEFYNAEYSWRIFLLMEAFSDEYGNWRFLPSKILGEDYKLLDDLMTWRWLKNTARRAKQDRVPQTDRHDLMDILNG